MLFVTAAILVAASFVDLSAVEEAEQREPYVPLNCEEPLNGTLKFIDRNTTEKFECKPDGLPCRGTRSYPMWLVCDAENFCFSRWIKNTSYIYPSWRNEYDHLDRNVKTGENRFSLKLQKVSVGNYTCILSNGTHNISREFWVYTVCDPVPNVVQPKPHQTEDACADQSILPGADALLYCEFCTRSRYNHTVLHWQKLVNNPLNETLSQWVPVDQLSLDGTIFTTNRTVVNNCGTWAPLYQDPKCFEAFDSVGSYLHIEGATQNAFGQYRLQAIDETTNTTVETKPIKLVKKIKLISDKTIVVLVALAGFFLIALLTGLLWARFNLDLKLLFRDRFSEVEKRGNRDYDAYIIYDSSSEEITSFVVEVIRPKLIESNYDVFIKDIDLIPGGWTAADIIDAINNSLRCILIVSESFNSEQGQYLEVQLNAAISDMAEKKTKIVPVLFGGVNVTVLGRLLVVLRCLRYKEKKTNKTRFLKRLLLRMPVKRKITGKSEGGKHGLVENMELAGSDEAN